MHEIYLIIIIFDTTTKLNTLFIVYCYICSSPLTNKIFQISFLLISKLILNVPIFIGD